MGGADGDPRGRATTVRSLLGFCSATSILLAAKIGLGFRGEPTAPGAQNFLGSGAREHAAGHSPRR